MDHNMRNARAREIAARLTELPRLQTSTGFNLKERWNACSEEMRGSSATTEAFDFPDSFDSFYTNGYSCCSSELEDLKFYLKRVQWPKILEGEDEVFTKWASFAKNGLEYSKAGREDIAMEEFEKLLECLLKDRRPSNSNIIADSCRAWCLVWCCIPILFGLFNIGSFMVASQIWGALQEHWPMLDGKTRSAMDLQRRSFMLALGHKAAELDSSGQRSLDEQLWILGGNPDKVDGNHNPEWLKTLKADMGISPHMDLNRNLVRAYLCAFLAGKLRREASDYRNGVRWIKEAIGWISKVTNRDFAQEFYRVQWTCYQCEMLKTLIHTRAQKNELVEMLADVKIEQLPTLKKKLLDSHHGSGTSASRSHDVHRLVQLKIYFAAINNEGTYKGYMYKDGRFAEDALLDLETMTPPNYSLVSPHVSSAEDALAGYKYYDQLGKVFLLVKRCADAATSHGKALSCLEYVKNICDTTLEYIALGYKDQIPSVNHELFDMVERNYESSKRAVHDCQQLANAGVIMQSQGVVLTDETLDDYFD